MKTQGSIAFVTGASHGLGAAVDCNRLGRSAAQPGCVAGQLPAPNVARSRIGSACRSRSRLQMATSSSLAFSSTRLNPQQLGQANRRLPLTEERLEFGTEPGKGGRAQQLGVPRASRDELPPELSQRAAPRGAERARPLF
jgi:hypothetical protein